MLTTCDNVTYMVHVFCTLPAFGEDAMTKLPPHHSTKHHHCIYLFKKVLGPIHTKDARFFLLRKFCWGYIKTPYI